MKRALVLIPAAILALSACGGSSTSTVTATVSTTSTVTQTAPAKTVTAPASTVTAPPVTVTAAGAQQAADATTTAAQQGSDVYYANCTEAKAAGAAPLYSGQPGYRSALDRDGDGVACES